MMFCHAQHLQRTRRILAETQAQIEQANKPKRRTPATFTPAQLRIGREWYERNQQRRT